MVAGINLSIFAWLQDLVEVDGYLNSTTVNSWLGRAYYFIKFLHKFAKLMFLPFSMPFYSVVWGITFMYKCAKLMIL